MEIIGHLLDGFLISFEPLNLGLVIFGAAVGLFIGAMPGLGSVNGVAILLPMTRKGIAGSGPPIGAERTPELA